MKNPDNHTRLHKIWSGMKYRCRHNKQYAGRGIIVCDEWQSFAGFKSWADKSGYREDLTIERIDVDGNYCPENCTWIPFGRQAKNRTTTRFVVYNSRVMSLAEAAEIANIPYKLAHGRIAKGWDVEKALNTPIQSGGGLKQKCRDAGIDYKIVHQRIHKLGWSEEEALHTPNAGQGANQTTYHHTA